MDQLHLKMNPAKTEFIYFGNKAQPKKCIVNSLNIACDLILRSDSIHYLGVWMDKQLNFKLHITKKCQAAMLSLLKIRNIRHLLTKNITESLLLSLCMSHLDYCNFVLSGLLDYSINRMQRIQNMCACLVLRKTNRYNIRYCMKSLHWLPIRQRIQHKVIALMYKCLKGEAPHYLSELIQEKTQGRLGLRSTSSGLLVIPRINAKTFTSRSFSVYAPTLWNALPSNIRSCTTLISFKSALKTHLFKQAYLE